MALYFLNFSIDSRDPNPDCVPEDLSINDIESVTEFVAEVVFNRVNAFQEHDEKDNDDGGLLDIYKYYCSNNSIVLKRLFSPISTSQKFQVRNFGSVQSPLVNILIPPPQKLVLTAFYFLIT
jgi:hypothetical protein